MEAFHLTLIDELIGLGFTVIIGLLGYLIKRSVDESRKDRIKQEALENAVLALLHARINDCYTEYVQKKKKLTLDKHQTIEALHAAYKELGGNHGEDKLYAALSHINPYVVDSPREEN